jgi:hypothetical protein
MHYLLIQAVAMADVGVSISHIRPLASKIWSSKMVTNTRDRPLRGSTNEVTSGEWNESNHRINVCVEATISQSPSWSNTSRGEVGKVISQRERERGRDRLTEKGSRRSIPGHLRAEQPKLATKTGPAAKSWCGPVVPKPSKPRRIDRIARHISFFPCSLLLVLCAFHLKSIKSAP